jgi:hypothetical protein
MRQWSFPLCLIETTEFHPEPLRANNHPAETAMVHIAAMLTHAWMDNGKFGEGLTTPHPATLQNTGLDLTSCRSIAEEVEPGIEHVLDTIYPLKKAS